MIIKKKAHDEKLHGYHQAKYAFPAIPIPDFEPACFFAKHITFLILHHDGNPLLLNKTQLNKHG